LASERLSFLAGQRHVIFLDVDIRDPGLLAHLRSVTYGHRHHVGVSILPEKMTVWSHWWRERRILMCLGRNLLFALSLVEKTKRALHPTGRTDVVAQRLKCAEKGNLRQVIFESQQLETKIRVGSGRLTDREARMALGVNHQHVEIVMSKD